MTKSHFRKLAVESLERRSVLSTTPFPDFNNDGLQDLAELTNPNTITISLANPDGSYALSAILTTPKNQPIQGFSIFDVDSDGDLDIIASTPKGSAWDIHTWLGDGDGTFGSRTTERWKISKHGWF